MDGGGGCAGKKTAVTHNLSADLCIDFLSWVSEVCLPKQKKTSVTHQFFLGFRPLILKLLYNVLPENSADYKHRWIMNMLAQKKSHSDFIFVCNWPKYYTSWEESKGRRRKMT